MGAIMHNGTLKVAENGEEKEVALLQPSSVEEMLSPCDGGDVGVFWAVDDVPFESGTRSIVGHTSGDSPERSAFCTLITKQRLESSSRQTATKAYPDWMLLPRIARLMLSSFPLMNSLRKRKPPPLRRPLPRQPPVLLRLQRLLLHLPLPLWVSVWRLLLTRVAVVDA